LSGGILMDWDEWGSDISRRVGFHNAKSKLTLLAPQDESDLTPEEAAGLSDVIHERLFSSNVVPATQLQILCESPPDYSFPLLFFSAWLVRNSEEAHIFWPHFQEKLVRGRISIQATQQLAYLIDTLWWKAHSELGLFRPQEGYVHIKWPQAHAGLTQHEIDLISKLIASHFGYSEVEPAILYSEPEYFLNLLRVWFQHQTTIPRRLLRIIHGSDAPALVTAEIAQKMIISSWPPDKSSANASGNIKPIQLPVIKLSPSPFKLSVLLPGGETKGDSPLIKARYNNETIDLVTSFLQSEQKTLFKSHEWAIDSLPWGQKVMLNLQPDPIALPVSPNCPYKNDGSGAMLFDFYTGVFLKKWHPSRQYYLLFCSRDLPEWANTLFEDIELINEGKIQDCTYYVFSLTARDIDYTSTLSQIIRQTEVELQSSSALITLPDADEFKGPRISLCGGLAINSGTQATYLINHQPTICINNLSDEANALAYQIKDDGGDLPINLLLRVRQESKAAYEIASAVEGLYAIKVGKARKYFRIGQIDNHAERNFLEINLHLPIAKEINCVDDIRNFQSEGITVEAWPFCHANLEIKTESGTSSFPIKLGSNGKKTVKGNEILLPSNTRWVKFLATAWLAQSNCIELATRPYILPSEFHILGDKVKFISHGPETNKTLLVSFIPSKPWEEPIYEQEVTVVNNHALFTTDTDLSECVWIVIKETDSKTVWLTYRFDPQLQTYSEEDFGNLLYQEFDCPDQIGASSPDHDLRKLYSVIQVSSLCRKLVIPFLHSPVPDSWKSYIDHQSSPQVMRIESPYGWYLSDAKILFDSPGCEQAKLATSYGMFKVDVHINNSEIEISWREMSKPCRCMHCQKIMPSELFNCHACCEKNPTSQYHLQDIVTTKRDYSWIAVFKSIEEEVLAMGIKTSSLVSPLLDQWQTIYRHFPPDKPSPTDWLREVFDSWFTLYDCTRSTDSDVHWQAKLDAVEPHIIAMSVLLGILDNENAR
jgi:hypothetical protein